MLQGAHEGAGICLAAKLLVKVPASHILVSESESQLQFLIHFLLMQILGAMVVVQVFGFLPPMKETEFWLWALVWLSPG